MQRLGNPTKLLLISAHPGFDFHDLIGGKPGCLREISDGVVYFLASLADCCTDRSYGYLYVITSHADLDQRLASPAHIGGKDVRASIVLTFLSPSYR